MSLSVFLSVCFYFTASLYHFGVHGFRKSEFKGKSENRWAQPILKDDCLILLLGDGIRIVESSPDDKDNYNWTKSAE